MLTGCRLSRPQPRRADRALVSGACPPPTPSPPAPRSSTPTTPARRVAGAVPAARGRDLPRRQLPGCAARGRAGRGRRRRRAPSGASGSSGRGTRPTGGAPQSGSATSSARSSAPRPARSSSPTPPRSTCSRSFVAAARMRPGPAASCSPTRDSFPTDLYVIALGGATCSASRWSTSPPREALARGRRARRPPRARLLLGQVDYRTGELWDLPAITRAVHDAGALMCWDLCHSAGAMPVGPRRRAVPTSPSAAATSTSTAARARRPSSTSRPRTRRTSTSPLTGWQGHATPFAMSPDYDPAATASPAPGWAPPRCSRCWRWRPRSRRTTGWPSQTCGPQSLSLTRFFLECLDALGVDLPVATPREDARRGSQVSLRHPAGVRRRAGAHRARRHRRLP